MSENIVKKLQWYRHTQTDKKLIHQRSLLICGRGRPKMWNS